jgi:uncharacterized DUF497 family protein
LLCSQRRLFGLSLALATERRIISLRKANSREVNSYDENS